MTACAGFRNSIDRLLDGELRPEERLALDSHLAGCPACREEHDSLRELQGALRALPQESLPAPALDEVWSRTVRAGRAAPSSPWRWAWGLAAAAALTAALLVPSLFSDRRFPTAPRDLEVARAEHEARLVFSLTAQALHRTERAARERVLGDRVAPALRRLPIRWTEAVTSDPRRNDL